MNISLFLLCCGGQDSRSLEKKELGKKKTVEVSFQKDKPENINRFDKIQFKLKSKSNSNLDKIFTVYLKAKRIKSLYYF